MDDTVNSLRKKLMTMGTASVVIIIIILLAVAFYAQNRVKQKGGAVVKTGDTLLNVTQVEQFNANGQMGLKIKGANSTIGRNQKFTVIVYADSKNEDIYSYDAFIRYNNKDFKYEEVQSLMEGVNVVDTDEDIGADYSELIITGEKTTKKGPMIFNNTALAEITFTALRPGKYTLGLVFELGGNKDSNLFNLKYQDILSKVTEVTFTVK